MNTRLLCATACLALVVGAGGALGAPSISSTSGTFSHGNSVTVSGSGFGTKSTAAPALFEDFEDGTDGDLLSGTSFWMVCSDNPTADKPQFSDDELRHSRSALSAKFTEYTGQDIAYSPDLGLDGQRVYIDLWMRFQWASLDKQHQNKLFKLQSDVNDNGSSNPASYPLITVYYWRYDGGSTSTYIPFANSGGIIVQDSISPPADAPGWEHWQMELLTNDIGYADGEYRAWRNGILVAEAYNLEIRLEGEDYFKCLWLGRFLGNHDGTLSTTHYYDDVCVDESWARVEVGDRPDWYDCAVRELQIPSQWSTSSIAATLKQNSLKAGAAWLYVFDGDGNVSNAQPVTITVSGGTTYALTVTSGMGGASYPAGTQIQIAAGEPPSGQAFHEWVGDVSCMNDVLDPYAAVTMPPSSASVTATFTEAPYIYKLDFSDADSSPSPGASWYTKTNTGTTTVTLTDAKGSTNGGASGDGVTMTLSSGWNEGTSVDQDGAYWHHDLAVGAEDHIAVGGPSSATCMFKFYGEAASSKWKVELASSRSLEGNRIADYKVNGSYDDGGYGDDFDSYWDGYKEGTVMVWRNVEPDANDEIELEVSAAASRYGYVSAVRLTAELESEGSAYYTLTVNSGTGDGDYAASTVVNISSDAAPSGYAFDEWVGDTAGIADVGDTTTTLTMPAANQTVTATYTDVLWTLTVNSGSGDGSYIEDQEVNVSADSAASGYAFDCWVGDTAHVSDVDDPSTYVTMPASNVTITATYEASGGGGGGTTLLVDWGDSAGNNVFEFSDWDNVYVPYWMSYSSAGPDGVVGASVYYYPTVGVSGSSESFSEGNTILVTWYNGTGSSVTFTPKISFDDPDYYVGGSSGTWYDMTELELANGESDTTSYTFTGGTAGSYQRVHVCRNIANRSDLMFDKFELVGQPVYTLTVNSGTGDGEYEEDEEVNISADTPPAYMEFDEWTGDTAYVTNVTSASTSVTMPADDVTITATYTDILYTLTVNSGSGDGSYAVSTNVNISADTPPAYMEFDCWVGNTSGIADVDDSTTSITMPGSNATITATYTDILYTLTVNSGSGDGSYAHGTNVNIVADAAPSSYEFDCWTGGTSGITDVNDPTTSIAIPGSNAEITATYAYSGPTVTLLVDWGDSAGNNVFEFSDWDNVYVPYWMSYSSAGPDGVVGASTYYYPTVGVNGSSESFAEGDTIVVTWYNGTGSSVTFTPKISFDDPDFYVGGSSGTWYDMTELELANGESDTTSYTFTGGTAGSYQRVHVCRNVANRSDLMFDKFELVEP
jgi:hypothetical protein